MTYTATKMVKGIQTEVAETIQEYWQLVWDGFRPDGAAPPPVTLSPVARQDYVDDAVEPLREQIETGRLSASGLSATIGAAKAGLSFTPCPQIEDSDTTGTAANPRPLDAFDGYIYANYSAGLYRATKPTGPWTLVTTFSGGSGTLSAIRETGDGEVIVAQGSYGIWRSTGWATNPLTATWALVRSVSAPITSFSLNVHKPLGWIGLTTYSDSGDMSNSRYVWLSQDYGKTWAQIYDATTAHPEVDPTHSHMHTVAFDPYHDPAEPRLWLVWHKTSDDPTFTSDPKNFMIYSDDKGATWTEYSTLDMHPLFFCATPAGMVHDTDSVTQGSSLFLLDRVTMEERRIYRRRNTAGETNLWSWGSRAIEGTDPGTWHILWRSTKANTPAGVTTTDGERTVETVTIPAETSSDIVDARDIMVLGDAMIGVTQQSVSSSDWEWWQVREPRRGVPGGELGNLGGGIASDGSVAVGLGAKASDATDVRAVVVGQGATTKREGVVIGYDATASNFNSVVVGYAASGLLNAVIMGSEAVSAGQDVVVIGAEATAPSRSVTIGFQATGGATDSVALGHTAKGGSSSVAIGKATAAQSSNSVAVGAGTTVGGSGVAVGQGITTSGANVVAVGQAAVAGALQAVALGSTASAGHQASVALGYGSATTATNQVALNARHVEVAELAADPSAPVANKARWYVKDNGAGKTQLCVRFPTGAVQILATEP